MLINSKGNILFKNCPFNQGYVQCTYIYGYVFKLFLKNSSGRGGGLVSIHYSIYCFHKGNRKKSSFFSGQYTTMGGGGKGLSIKEKITFQMFFFQFVAVLFTTKPRGGG